MTYSPGFKIPKKQQKSAYDPPFEITTSSKGSI